MLYEKPKQIMSLKVVYAILEIAPGKGQDLAEEVIFRTSIPRNMEPCGLYPGYERPTRLPKLL